MSRKVKKFVVNPKVSADPRNVLHYLSERGLHKHTDAKQVIKSARLWLDDDDYMWGVELWEESKGWPKITEKKLEQMVKKAMTKKYQERSSPMFSAADLCGVIMQGNDKTKYISAKRGRTCAWSHINVTKTRKRLR